MIDVHAETVGSFLRPPELLLARQRFKQNLLSCAELRAAEDRAIRDVVRSQEEVGFRVVTDGEFRRENWWIDFVANLRGLEIREGSSATSFDRSYVPKSPTRLHFHGGRNAVSTAAYPDIEAFFGDVAGVYQAEIASLEQAGCRYIQIDDPLLTYFLSPKLRADVMADGDDPDRRLAHYLDWLNACIANRRPETTIGVHLCRGNARSEWISEGTYEGIAEACFGTLKVDRYLLEFDDERSGSFAPLRFMPRDKQVVLGLVTTKRPQLEDAGMLKRRIEEATRYVGLDRMAISPQCGFASVVEGNKITPENQRRKLELVAAVAAEIWGQA